jgi:hypothetical protein
LPLATWRLDRLWFCRTNSLLNDCHHRPVKAFAAYTPRLGIAGPDDDIPG